MDFAETRCLDEGNDTGVNPLHVVMQACILTSVPVGPQGWNRPFSGATFVIEQNPKVPSDDNAIGQSSRERTWVCGEEGLLFFALQHDLMRNVEDRLHIFRSGLCVDLMLFDYSIVDESASNRYEKHLISWTRR